MSVKLIWITPDAESLLTYIARVSNPDGQAKRQSPERLIHYLISHAHWSPFEMASACVEIETTRDIGRQILRHRSFSFQEFCIAGDSKISFDLPNGKTKDDYRQHYKLAIADLWDKWHNGAKPIPNRWTGAPVRIPMRDRLSQMRIRVFDETTHTFVTARILDVRRTGVHPIFEIELHNGKRIKCTKEHKFLTQSGFLPLEEAIGLELRGQTAVMTRPDTALACNGVEAYQSPNWMAAAKARAISSRGGLAQIASEAGVATHTIRKWLRIHNLQFSKKEVASYSPVWNKGVSGYNLPRHKQTAIEKMRAKARRGSASNLWRGGTNRSERLKIADWCSSYRSEFLRRAHYKCARCDSSKALQLHHKQRVVDRPDLAYDKMNIEVLCKCCHAREHGLSGEYKAWREKARGNVLTVRWAKVRSVRYVGAEMTYDLEIDHPSHNYVANGIVVHNSQRYANVTDVLPPAPTREARLQDAKNRQNSFQTDDAELHEWWERKQREIGAAALSLYAAALAEGIAKEVARAVLPEGLTMSRMYMAGTVRSWIHYLGQRTGVATQKEHREIAMKIQAVLTPHLPATFSACGLIQLTST